MLLRRAHSERRDEMSASERLEELLKLKPHSAVAVHDPSNMFYLTEGYTGEGMVFLSLSKRVILTDFRYTEQAEKQAPDFTVVMTDKDHQEKDRLAELVKEGGITELMVETNWLSVDRYQKIKAAVGEEVGVVPLNEAPDQNPGGGCGDPQSLRHHQRSLQRHSFEDPARDDRKGASD